jgi:2-polyprenyl-3-methyl-5-hydroxy-6-metoxy-1,4-benzoquinol methylase
MNDFITKQCPVCRNIRPELMQWIESVGEVQRIMCKGCDTIYFDREPPTKPIYDMKYNLNFFRPGDIRKAGIMAAKLAELIQDKWKNPNILEAGSGNGLTVLLLRAMGLNAFGIDLDPALSVYLMEKFKVPIITAKFEEFNPPGKYHLIYSSHVIEHCEKPLEFMKKAADLLIEDGILYLDTPDTYYWNLQGKRWHHFETRDPYEHCCLLGQVGIRILANDTGLYLKKIERYGDFMSMQAILTKPSKS